MDRANNLFSLTIELDEAELLKIVRVLPDELMDELREAIVRHFNDFQKRVKEEHQKFEVEARRIMGGKVVQLRGPRR